MDKYNFSVIIPHKNAPKLLERCLQSIPQRDDLQIIIADDNSDASSVAELKKINRPNVEILYGTESKGAGNARNRGLELACGKWLLFADCDDFYENGINQFLDSNLNSSADCIYFSVNSVDSETLAPSMRNFRYDDYMAWFNTSRPGSEDWIMFHKWEPWNKMISHALVKKNNIRFDEFLKCNDMMFCIMVSYFAKKVKIIPDHLYCVTYNSKSMTFRNTKPEEFRDCLMAFQKKNVVMHKIGHWRWHMPMAIQHRFFIKKEGFKKYFSLLVFYLRNYCKMRSSIRSFKKQISSTNFESKTIVD